MAGIGKMLGNINSALGNLSPQQRAMLLRAAASNSRSPIGARGLSAQAQEIMQAEQQRLQRESQMTLEKSRQAQADAYRKAQAEATRLYRDQTLQGSKETRAMQSARAAELARHNKTVEGYQGASAAALADQRAAKTAEIKQRETLAKKLEAEGNFMGAAMIRSGLDPMEMMMMNMMGGMGGMGGSTPEPYVPAENRPPAAPSASNIKKLDPNFRPSQDPEPTQPTDWKDAFKGKNLGGGLGALMDWIF